MDEISRFENGKLYFLLTEIDELPAMHNPTKQLGQIEESVPSRMA
jgi:hypothetical protein